MGEATPLLSNLVGNLSKTTHFKLSFLNYEGPQMIGIHITSIVKFQLERQKSNYHISAVRGKILEVHLQLRPHTRTSRDHI